MYSPRFLARSQGDVWTFFAAVVVGSPALFLIRPPEYVAERYFLISFVFFLLLVAFVLGHLWRRVVFRPLVLALLVGFLAGNAYQVRAFAEAGRGDFGEALAWIAEQDDGDPLLITGDHDFRVRLYVKFYARRQSLSRVRYLADKESVGANWLFVHRTGDDERSEPAEFQTIGPVHFRQVKGYPSRGRASWGWYVYRITTDAPG